MAYALNILWYERRRYLAAVLAVFARHGFEAAAEIGEVRAADGGLALEVMRAI